jgi:hypothetical protein
MPKFNVILFCDTPAHATKTRGYGTHRLASHIRERGYTCLVVDFSCIINWKLYNEILESTMGEETYMVGFSTTFMPFRIPGSPPSTEVPGRARRHTDEERFNKESIYTDCLITDFGHGKPERWLNRIKEINPNTKVVLGGTGVGFYVDFKNVDNFIFGLSETMAIDYLDSVSRRGNRRLFSRVLVYDYKAQAPVWDFRKSTTTYTEYDFITPNETLSLEIGRGCRFKCTYCSYPLMGQKNIDDYLKFKEVLRQELMENYERWGTTQYYMMDDTFNDSTEKLLMVKEVFDSLPFKVKFWCYLRLDLLALHPEQIPLLKELGLNQTYFGIETFHPKAGKSIGKGMSAEKRKIALDNCKEIWGDDVHIQSGFMVGLPHEPEESIIETAAYLRDPNCPIHEPWIFPVNMFNSHYEDPAIAWLFKSDFDKNFDKHGYYFDQPVTMENITKWRKDDGTGISNSDQAATIAGKWDKTVPKRLYTADFYKSSLDHPVLKDRDLTKKMTHAEYESFVNSLDLEDIFYTTVTTQYFEPLLKKLKSK